MQMLQNDLVYSLAAALQKGEDADPPAIEGGEDWSGQSAGHGIKGDDGVNGVQMERASARATSGAVKEEVIERGAGTADDEGEAMVLEGGMGDAGEEYAG